MAYSTGTGDTCALITATGNTPPTVNPGAGYTVPKQTPFTLTGSATDPNGDALTYLWEEFDLGTASPPQGDTDAARPIFRTFTPATSPSRTFPKLADILCQHPDVRGVDVQPHSHHDLSPRRCATTGREAGASTGLPPPSVSVPAPVPFVVTQPTAGTTWNGGRHRRPSPGTSPTRTLLRSTALPSTSCFPAMAGPPSPRSSPPTPPTTAAETVSRSGSHHHPGPRQGPLPGQRLLRHLQPQLLHLLRRSGGVLPLRSLQRYGSLRKRGIARVGVRRPRHLLRRLPGYQHHSIAAPEHHHTRPPDQRDSRPELLLEGGRTQHLRSDSGPHHRHLELRHAGAGARSCTTHRGRPAHRFGYHRQSQRCARTR